MIVLSEPRQDASIPFEEYVAKTQQTVAAGWVEGQLTPPKRSKLAAGEGVTIEVRGEFSGVRLVGLHTAILGADHFHQVFAWTVPSRWDAERPVFVKVGRSLREAGSAQPGAPADPAVDEP